MLSGSSRSRDLHFHTLAWPGDQAGFCRHGLIGMGVADGVYQWREQGIDAGEFSRLLMQTALQAVEEGQPDVLKGQPCSHHFSNRMLNINQ